MKRTVAVLSALLLAVGVAGCSDEPDTPATSSAQAPAEAADTPLPDDAAAMLEDLGVGGEGVREAIVALDQLDQPRPLPVQGSVLADQVVFNDGTQEVAVPIPGDEVYVSIAPYVSQTHDCYYHALGGCQGELTGEEVEVTITDDDGETLVEETATTYTNGFVGFWLPEDRSGTIEITQGERTGETPFDTSADGATCITTLQLS